ncbi:uncharacterized protein IL334_001634 [Kwoniella shivajii]|uniref:Uncharacterized protein n=1 Tax=Kwoniella shivajii TaxID=564305 RepID=A0ABZ1CU18_9TREE|nr:hypothetical protein IL334_001634 [Kwoniella shivajii]
MRKQKRTSALSSSEKGWSRDSGYISQISLQYEAPYPDTQASSSSDLADDRTSSAEDESSDRLGHVHYQSTGVGTDFKGTSGFPPIALDDTSGPSAHPAQETFSSYTAYPSDDSDLSPRTESPGAENFADSSRTSYSSGQDLSEFDSDDQKIRTSARRQHLAEFFRKYPSGSAVTESSTYPQSMFEDPFDRKSPTEASTTGELAINGILFGFDEESGMPVVLPDSIRSVSPTKSSPPTILDQSVGDLGRQSLFDSSSSDNTSAGNQSSGSKNSGHSVFYLSSRLKKGVSSAWSRLSNKPLVWPRRWSQSFENLASKSRSRGKKPIDKSTIRILRDSENERSEYPAENHTSFPVNPAFSFSLPLIPDSTLSSIESPDQTPNDSFSINNKSSDPITSPGEHMTWDEISRKMKNAREESQAATMSEARLRYETSMAAAGLETEEERKIPIMRERLLRSTGMEDPEIGAMREELGTLESYYHRF